MPQEHDLRHTLCNEAHARPYLQSQAPTKVSFLVLLNDSTHDDVDEVHHLKKLSQQYGATSPRDDASHYDADMGRFSIKWERHTEFSLYIFFNHQVEADLYKEPASKEVPKEWLADLPGKLLVAQHIYLLLEDEPPIDNTVLARHFRQDSLVGSHVSGGKATAWTDFRVHKDGYSRVLLINHALGERQTGRLLQHFIELETYRMLALLSLPLVTEKGTEITEIGVKLREITERMVSIGGLEQEHELLSELTQLEANIERINMQTSYRFSATQAYQDITLDRLNRLRESRIEGVQMLSRFLERRMLPAIKTCTSVASQIENLSVRVARASHILSARVNLGLASQNRDLLHSMDKRAKFQFRLQETIEGLSIAAISYYIVGLISYLLKSIKALGVPINSEFWLGSAIPIVILSVWFTVRQVKKRINKQGEC